MEDSIGPEVCLISELGERVAIQRHLSWQWILILSKEWDVLDHALHLTG
jgi:hypothetical protein